MTHERSPVALLQVPEEIKPRQERIFMNELKSYMQATRPRIVLDCSKLRRVDRPAIHLLLCCLEEALKHNGDVRLAAIPEAESEIFDRSALEGLFEVFETIPSAVNSFQPAPASMISQQDVSRGSNQLL
jgi:anti-anti-sigma regulatory factor